MASTSALPAAETAILPCARPFASVVTSVACPGNRLRLAIGIFMGNQLQVYLGLYGLIIVVHRSYVKERAVAHADRIAHRLDMDAEAAAGSQKASAPRDLAVRLIGYRSLHGVVLIRRPLQVGNVLRGHVDGQLAVGVELARLFRLLRSIVAQRSIVPGVSIGAHARTFIAATVFIPPIVGGVVHAVLYLGIGDRLAEEVPGSIITGMVSPCSNRALAGLTRTWYSGLR